MLKQQTPEQIQRRVSAAYDSVNLINKLVLETIDDNKRDTVDRNVKHLEVMLAKDFFAEALTAEQTTEIETCIAAGKTYIA